MTASEPRALPGVIGLGQVSLLVHDTARAEAFYRDVLGLRHLFTFGALAFFDLDGVRLLLAQPEDGVWRPGSVLYLRIPDITAAHEALVARGVAFEGARTSSTATPTALRSGWRSSATRTRTSSR